MSHPEPHKTKKLVCLSVKDKLKILKLLDDGETRKNIYSKFNCSAPTVSRIIKQKDTILKVAAQNQNLLRKRQRTGAQKQVDKSLSIWFKDMRSKNAIITGPMLMDKAKSFSLMLDVDFEPTNGWLDRWKKRENIQFKKLCGEKNSADTVAANAWLENVWPDIRQNYDPDDIYNADESGLMFKALPTGSLVNRTEHPSGMKLPKDRITILFVSNSTGTDKMIFCIGKSRNPRCFNKNTIPVKYYANTKAWMTSNIWTMIMQDLDNTFKAKKKKVLLIVDNASCHKLECDVNLGNIKIDFFPPNATSVMQPLDQGIIHCFKAHYRRCITKKQLLHLDNGESLSDFSKKINLLIALKMIKRAWWMVTPLTIKNCFRKAGLTFNSDEEVEVEPVDEENNFPTAIREEIDYLVNIDQDLPCFGDMTDEDIINEAALQFEELGDNRSASENDSDVEILGFQKPTLQEAFKSLGVLKQFSDGDIELELILDEIEYKMMNCHFKSLSQTKIDDFFKRK
ncbi:tigger transposable element-derived protein 6-like [Eupeodes corollae]|uniref:tigger transposable element-derived protein 6-like n=2 Tax=Eupeodes corollae TaxID=290404 RepID=UPI002492ED0C|nr:tigger transposable element-derived protein 6-like [Eupeodes corollae]XP_055904304.1 tigger transposable element-derived protein 6-like [Eupeodes corollae]XP_055907171.1 tigger transposable element-derived protein 6-like [Eupeodes corollae]